MWNHFGELCKVKHILGILHKICDNSEMSRYFDLFIFFISLKLNICFYFIKILKQKKKKSKILYNIIALIKI